MENPQKNQEEYLDLTLGLEDSEEEKEPEEESEEPKEVVEGFGIGIRPATTEDLFPGGFGNFKMEM